MIQPLINARTAGTRKDFALHQIEIEICTSLKDPKRGGRTSVSKRDSIGLSQIYQALHTRVIEAPLPGLLLRRSDQKETTGMKQFQRVC